jgi:glycerophosphoryl diester phosphodiesterase
VLAHAHQGGAFEGPSSTLFAIDRALEHGASAIELDVHASSDGVLVVCHDPDVDRTTDGRGAIASLTYEALRRLDNAYYFVPGHDSVTDAREDQYVYRGRVNEDPRFRIASLEEVLERYPGVLLNLDIKQSAPAVKPYEELLAELLRRFGRRDDVIVASFSDDSLARFGAAAPEIGVSYGTNDLTQFIQAVRQGKPVPRPRPNQVALQPPARYAGVWLVDEALVTAAHNCGLAVHVWTADDVADMEKLCDLGVDGIITNRPSELVRLLKDRGLLYARE